MLQMKLHFLGSCRRRCGHGQGLVGLKESEDLVEVFGDGLDPVTNGLMGGRLNLCSMYFSSRYT